MVYCGPAEAVCLHIRYSHDVLHSEEEKVFLCPNPQLFCFCHEDPGVGTPLMVDVSFGSHIVGEKQNVLSLDYVPELSKGQMCRPKLQLIYVVAQVSLSPTPLSHVRWAPQPKKLASDVIVRRLGSLKAHPLSRARDLGSARTLVWELLLLACWYGSKNQ